MTQFCQSWFSRYLRFLKSCGRYNATFIPGIVLQVWYLWSPRSIVPYHVTRCITSSIDMSGPPVYGREFLSLLLNSNLLLVVQIVCSLEFLPFFGTPISPLHRINFVGCVNSLHFRSSCWYVSPLDSASGNASAAFPGLNKSTAATYSGLFARVSWV